MDSPRPVRLQLSRRRGFKLSRLSVETNGLEVVNVARPSRWGNPYIVEPGMPADTAVMLFRSWLVGALEAQRFARDELAALRGKNLACWCAPGEPCHADVLLEFANRGAP